MKWLQAGSLVVLASAALAGDPDPDPTCYDITAFKCCDFHRVHQAITCPDGTLCLAFVVANPKVNIVKLESSGYTQSSFTAVELRYCQYKPPRCIDGTCEHPLLQLPECQHSELKSEPVACGG